MVMQQPVNGLMQGGNALLAPLPPLPPPMLPPPPMSMSQTVPVSTAPPPLPPMADLPPPHMLAPMVYRPRLSPPPMAPGYAPGSMNANYQNNFYNQAGGHPYPYYHPQQPQQYAQQQAPAMPPQAQQPPVQPPANPPQPQPPVTPPQQQTPPPPPAPATPPAAKPTTPPALPAEDSAKLGATLDEATVVSLNKRLNDGNAEIRGNAGMDLYKLLEANPAVAEDPKYKPYVDAFLQKMLADPSTLGKQPAFLALEMGLVKNPSDAVRQQIQHIADTPGGTFDIDQQVARNILGQLATTAAAPQQFQGAPTGAAPETVPGEKLDITSPATAATMAPVPRAGQNLNIQDQDAQGLADPEQAANPADNPADMAAALQQMLGNPAAPAAAGTMPAALPPPAATGQTASPAVNPARQTGASNPTILPQGGNPATAAGISGLPTGMPNPAGIRRIAPAAQALNPQGGRLNVVSPAQPQRQPVASPGGIQV